MSVANIKSLEYKGKSSNSVSKITEKGLIKKVNNLIDSFNKLDSELFGMGIYAKFNYLEKQVFEEKGMTLHRNYLLQYLHELKNGVYKLAQEFSSDRTKEFNEFLKSLENMGAAKIVGELFKFKMSRFAKYKAELENAIKVYFECTLDKVIKSHLKSKQQSRQKQLLEKFENVQENLGDPKNKKQRNFVDVLKSLIDIFSGKGKNLDKNKINILEDCFSGDRNWPQSCKKMDRRFNPFPHLDDETNRIIIGLYCIITDNSGDNIDPLINKYLA